MGPGMLVKACLRSAFSLMVFGWTQILMDLQPLFAMVTGHGPLHGITHTVLGATCIGAIAAPTGKYAAQFVWRFVQEGHTAMRPLSISWGVAIVSALIGSYSHVLLDAIMHTDLHPLAPMSKANPLLGWISIGLLHRLCLYSGVVGAAAYAAVGFRLANRSSNS